MKKVLIAIILLTAIGNAQEIPEETPVVSEEPSFIDVSDHCYVLHIEENGENLAVVATDQGVLLFDPPPEPDLSILIEYLKNLPGGRVRWMVNTGQYLSQTVGVEHYARQGAVLLTGFHRKIEPEFVPAPFSYPFVAPGVYRYRYPNSPAAPVRDQDEGALTPPDIYGDEEPDIAKFVFKRRMYLYPENVEIQIQALPHEARTGADIFVYVPDEKVLFVGRLFEPGYYPDIDVSTGGSALKWIDALEHVIGSVPLLISAIPPEEPEEEEAENEEYTEEMEENALEEVTAIDGEEEEEKTLEEMITVIPARGEVANLQMMKDLLDTVKKLRNGMGRAVKAGQSCDNYLDSPSVDLYLDYGNFFPFATQLCKELSPENDEPEASK